MKKKEKSLGELVVELLARGDKDTWNVFIKHDSKNAAKKMIKCINIIKNLPSNPTNAKD